MRSSQRGSALIVTMILITALLAGAAALTQVQVASTKGTEMTTAGMRSQYCAEAGLTAAVQVAIANYPQWAASLATYPSTAEPAWLAAGIGSHDLDGDGVADFTAYIKDNDDELAGAIDPTRDNDLRVFVVARCTHSVDAPREVEVLIQVSGGGTCYGAQLGGCNSNNNTN